jgi:hypothetical protein
VNLVSTRAVDVQILMDSETIGSGTIEYIDDAVCSTQELYKDRCVAQVLCIGSTCYENGAVFCYRDTLAKNQGGVDEVTLKIPIEVDGAVVGEAELPLIDAYAGVIQLAPFTQLVSVYVLAMLIELFATVIAEAVRKE